MIVDTQASGNNRKITAFLGGLDLCDGRYDTPEHRLHRDLDTVFQGDYHNPTFSVSSFSLECLFLYPMFCFSCHICYYVVNRNFHDSIFLLKKAKRDINYSDVVINQLVLAIQI